MSAHAAEITDLLNLCLLAHPADLPLIEMSIQNIGANTLLPHSSRPLPAVIIHNFAKHSVTDTDMLVRYLEIFLQNGFDSHRFGAACLRALSEINDEKMLICAQLLLDHGTAMSSGEYQSLLRTVSFQCAYHDLQTKNYYLANLCFAYRQMLLEYFSHPPIRHTNIAHYTCACNKPIGSILFNKNEHPLKHIYITLPDGILIIQNHPNIYMCSSIESSVTTEKPFILTSHPTLSSLLDKHIIRSINFTAPPNPPDNAALPHPDIRIFLDNGAILISHNPQKKSLEISLV